MGAPPVGRWSVGPWRWQNGGPKNGCAWRIRADLGGSGVAAWPTAAAAPARCLQGVVELPALDHSKIQYLVSYPKKPDQVSWVDGLVGRVVSVIQWGDQLRGSDSTSPAPLSHPSHPLPCRPCKPRFCPPCASWRRRSSAPPTPAPRPAGAAWSMSRAPSITFCLRCAVDGCGRRPLSCQSAAPASLSVERGACAPPGRCRRCCCVAGAGQEQQQRVPRQPAPARQHRRTAAVWAALGHQWWVGGSGSGWGRAGSGRCRESGWPALHQYRRPSIASRPPLSAADGFGQCCGFPVTGYATGGVSNGTSGGSAISPEVWGCGGESGAGLEGRKLSLTCHKEFSHPGMAAHTLLPHLILPGLVLQHLRAAGALRLRPLQWRLRVVPTHVAGGWGAGR